MDIPWKERPANTPPSTFYSFLVLLAGTFLDALKEPTQAAFLVQLATEKVEKDLPQRHREEEDESDKIALKWCWNRLRYDRANLRILRTKIYEQASHPGALGTAMQDLARLVEVVIREADAANDRAPQMNPMKKVEVEALPNGSLPEPPAALPKVVNYRALISE